jgi:hypothetical protein
MLIIAAVELHIRLYTKVCRVRGPTSMYLYWFDESVETVL